MFYTQLFTVLKRIADDRRDGQLPIHVRFGQMNIMPVQNL